MKILVTAQQMRLLDQYTIDQIGIPSLVLMENAGRSVAEEIFSFIQAHGQSTKPWLAIAGKGHNGADALVAARHLYDLGVPVQLLYADSYDQWSHATRTQAKIAKEIGISVIEKDSFNLRGTSFSGIIDGLLGTGTKGAPRQHYASLIEQVNRSKLPVFAVDIPSGVNADTGEVNSICIQATVTVTFAFLKRGLCQYPGKACAGQVKVRSIGIPSSLPSRLLMDQVRVANQTMIEKYFHMSLPLLRAADVHKGSCGHVLAIAGSQQYHGAGVLTTKAALRSGCGLVSWALPSRLCDVMYGVSPEVIVTRVDDRKSGDWSNTSPTTLLELAKGKQTVVIGPGLGRFAGDIQWLRALWEDIDVPIVVDADALNMLADAGGLEQAAWKKRKSTAILTPHPGEMARLVQVTTREVQADRIGIAQSYATKHGVVLVLKGAATVTALPSGEVFVNTTGNAGMATGGSGDVLAGIIAGFIAQGMKPEAAATIGVYVHGEAGDRAAAIRHSSASLLASDIIEAL